MTTLSIITTVTLNAMITTAAITIATVIPISVKLCGCCIQNLCGLLANFGLESCES